MSADVVEKWLASQRHARANGVALRPVEHSGLRGIPLSIQKGQAEAFCLAGDDGRRWILKKFHPGRQPERAYLEAIRSVLPKSEGFLSGTAREVLSSASLARDRGGYYCPHLARWLDHTILMPRISGADWASLADEMREGRVRLQRSHRLTLCRGLTDLVAELEQNGCCHRDLSSGNVFVDTNAWKVQLIDFDSLFHATLPMPAATTCGTVGYTPPFAWRGATLDPAATWCVHADRYALAVLNAEFLVLGQGAPLTAEGGMFDQGELRMGRGKGVECAAQGLKVDYPQAVPLFEAAVRSANFEGCPPPGAWSDFLDKVPDAPVRPPQLDELDSLTPQFFERLLQKCRPAAPLWPAPSLGDLPLFDAGIPQSSVPVVSLPPDPWRATG